MVGKVIYTKEERVGVFFLLVHLRPYIHERTFWVDVAGEEVLGLV